MVNFIPESFLQCIGQKIPNKMSDKKISTTKIETGPYFSG